MTDKQCAHIISLARKTNFHWQMLQPQEIEEKIKEQYEIETPLLQLSLEETQDLVSALKRKQGWVTKRKYGYHPDHPDTNTTPEDEEEPIIPVTPSQPTKPKIVWLTKNNATYLAIPREGKYHLVTETDQPILIANTIQEIIDNGYTPQ
jgi:hypothetical protein